MRRLILISLCAAGLVTQPASAATLGLEDGEGLKVLSQKQLSPRLFEASVETDALPGPANLRVLMPRGYARHPDRRWPVLYLIHGTSGGAPDWTVTGDAEKTTRKKNLIVVMPDIALDYDGGGWCTDWPNGPYAWETFHIKQLVPFIDDNLRTRRNRGGRVIAGLSQGGFCAMTYAARHPDLFSSVASFSGVPDIAHRTETIVGSTLIINATEVGLDGVPPNSMFGDRGTNEVNWKAHDPATLVENLRNTRMYLFTGNGQPGPYDDVSPVSIPGFLGSAAIETLVHEDNTYFHDQLNGLGIPHFYNDYGPGAHAWGYWARDLREVIGPLMHDIRHPAPRGPVTYTSADDRWSAYGWRVRMKRTAREFSSIEDATCRSFTVAGSGAALVRTPPCLEPGAMYRIRMDGEDVSAGAGKPAGPRGRLRFRVPLGPANPYQQYTAEAEAAGTHVFRTRVTIKRARSQLG